MAEVHCRLIVLAAGEGKRFQEVGYKEPKPFIEILGVRMIELVIANMRSQLGVDCPVTIITQDKFGRIFGQTEFYLDKTSVIRLGSLTGGAAETALWGLKHGPDMGEKIVIANCDQLVLFDGKKMLKSLDKHAGSILTFDEPGRNPKWSYAEINKKGLITRVAEKNPISDHATVGVYGYANRNVAIDAISKMMAANDRFNNEFYLCPAYNYIDGTISNVSSTRMWGLGTPEDVQTAIADKDFATEIETIRRIVMP